MSLKCSSNAQNSNIWHFGFHFEHYFVARENAQRMLKKIKQQTTSLLEARAS
ncbi:hypothetical protein [Aulosira sp. FACHB-615]|uniref:hypothetical protein n=1 Tax=Aulosira sp. FACHB-615 TaxID=2692777 RepID=UPI001685EFBE|nr:hypothetical protein [Aulosira sp. FACHB-615]MBD2487154.1 hypothetical protein [Aulosira sp. FACHB-615]